MRVVLPHSLIFAVTDNTVNVKIFFFVAFSSLVLNKNKSKVANIAKRKLKLEVCIGLRLLRSSCVEG